MEKFQIADLHCDLLCYLAADPLRTPFDTVVRCSIPQMKAGHVKIQTMAIFTETGPGSVDSGLRQAQLFSELAVKYASDFTWEHTDQKICILSAIENASSFCDEHESLDSAFQRLENHFNPLYISLTWNTENRFGGGAHTSIGLKPDGCALLGYINGKKIALDLSHTSDALAFDCLNYINKKQLDIPVIASHSNSRKVANMPRNLPDELICEIIQRQGLIGMNFVRPFVGNFVRQLDHFLSLGAQKRLCFGADFFYENDVSPAYRKKPEDLFFPGFDHAGVYPQVIGLWKEHLGLPSSLLNDIAFNNFSQWLSQRST